MLEIRGIWLRHISRWDRYVLHPRIWVETPRFGTVPHIGPYNIQLKSRPRYRVGLYRLDEVGLATETDVGSPLAPWGGPTKELSLRWTELFENLRGRHSHTHVLQKV